MALSKQLKKFIKADNIVTLLLEREDGDSLLVGIGQKCLQGLDEDYASMKDWLIQADQAMDLAGLKEEVKNYPFSKAANIKFPLVTTAVLQYTSRTIGEMMRDGKVCNYKVNGRDPAQLKARRGQRRSLHMNWQVMEKIPNWMSFNEKLLQQWAVVGSAFKKTWYDPCLKCPRSEMIPYDQLILNYNEPTLEDAPRISHYLYQSKNKIVEFQRYGLYDNIDDIDALTMDGDDTDTTSFELVEQHCWLDLDEDGYAEPYVVTIHVASGRVLRLVTRFEERDVEFNDDGEIQKIIPMNYFTLFTFLPSLDGSIFGIGIGTYLSGMNKATNTALNALINAGHLATMQGGFLGKGLRIPKKDLQLDPGEWVTAASCDGSALKDNIVPFNYKEPSMVLFQLVQYLVEAGKTLSASTDVMTGTSDTTNVSPTTIMSMIQQSLTTYVPIQRRFFRGLKDELRKLALLNERYLDIMEYMNLIDPSEQEIQEMFDEEGKLIDYDLSQVDVVPIVDQNESTRQETLLKTQALNAFLQPLIPTGKVDVSNFITYNCRALEIDPEIYQNLIAQPQPAPPDPQLLEVQRKSQRDQAEMQIKAAEVMSKGEINQSKSAETQAKIMKTMSDAEVDQAKAQMMVYSAKMKDQQADKDRELKKKTLDVQLAQSAMKMATDTHNNNVKAAAAGVKGEKKELGEPRKPTPNHAPARAAIIKLAQERGFKINNGGLSRAQAIQLAKQRGFNVKGGDK